MIYNYPKLRESHPQIIAAALRAGRLTLTQMYIELPDDFDFGAEEKPVPVPPGLGDTFSKYIAQPIAKTIDLVTGTNIVNCGGCEERKLRMNEHHPDKTIDLPMINDKGVTGA